MRRLLLLGRYRGSKVLGLVDADTDADADADGFIFIFGIAGRKLIPIDLSSRLA